MLPKFSYCRMLRWAILLPDPNQNSSISNVKYYTHRLAMGANNA